MRARRRLVAAALACAGIYAAIALAMFVFQRDLQYLPSRGVLDPRAIGLQGVERVQIRTPDGETLTAWHKPASSGRATILYLHGNGGSLASRPRKLGSYAASPFGLLALSYRGYGDSTGSPSERGLVTDALAAYAWLEAKGAIRDGGVAVIGESLGSGVAVQLAAAKPVRALMLEAPYTSATDVAAQAYPWLPVRLLLKDTFRSVDHIGKVKAPLLVQHGTDDAVIPFTQGQALCARANEPKRFVAIEGGTHDGVIGDAAVWAREIAFLAAH
jgi:hypothetical protein